jgi:putative tributyrin esterase
MALFQVDFYSKSLSKVTNFNVILPNDVPFVMESPTYYQRNMKALYLLHGYSASNKEWMLGSSVQEMAVKYNLAIIMPAGDNSFYLDSKGTGKAYCRYVGEELIEYTRKTFALLDKKEDTYIGGLSMGGFGAIHTGLAFPQTFHKIIALSSGLIIHDIEHMKEGEANTIADYDYYTSVFGDLNQLRTSVNNPEYQIIKLKESGQEIPSIFMACGTKDFLLQQNRAFYNFLNQENVNVKYMESPGTHNWKFWDSYLEPSIQWMLNDDGE